MSITAGRKRDLVTFHCAGKPYSLKYKHKTLKDVVEQSGKSVMDLFGDPFAGWPYLLAAGIRHNHRDITPDDGCELIDQWIDGGGDLKGIQKLLLDALTETGYLTKTPDEGEPASGNSPAPTPTV